MSTIDQAEIDAIVGGYHGSPRKVLGIHATESTGAGETKSAQTIIRSFRPLDNTAFVLDMVTHERHPMEKIDAAGLFEAKIACAPSSLHYRLVVSDKAGNEYELDDPYRFDPWLSEDEALRHAAGDYIRGYEKLGAHFRTISLAQPQSSKQLNITGVNFAVWAPNALRVSVIGPFNGWDNRAHPMQSSENGGLWEIFIPGLPEGTEYKYSIKSQHLGYEIEKTDPYGFYAEVRPQTASRVWSLDRYEWQDQSWLQERAESDALNRPINIYEVHLGSWRRVPEDDGFLSYQDLAYQLVDYVEKMGYTHIELLPITEHPFDGSWGYQAVGYFSPTSRFGTPEELMFFVDHCHQHGIGVILDWVPAHFPKDAHGLAFFDGTHLYEHADPRVGEHKDWGTKIFNFSRNEVQNFLLNSALFWLEKYHLDGLRVDAVAAMLYLDYSRESGEWIPNEYGGRENIAAIEFIRRFNEVIHAEVPGALTFAEESTSWPMVTHPVYAGGLGFDLKWNMGWMHDTLDYMQKDSIHRRFHHNQITFSLMYAFSENFTLPFSHDEVVHLKKSMLGKMPGDDWQKFANLRALYAYMMGHPGKKLLFMGSEFGQWREWSEARSLDWHLLEQTEHQQLQHFVQELNHFYRREPALYEVDFDWSGFEWIDISDIESSIISFVRRSSDKSDEKQSALIFICNFTPVPRPNYRVGLPQEGSYREVLNSDWPQFGGSGVETGSHIEAESMPWQSCHFSAEINLPPLGVTILKINE